MKIDSEPAVETKEGCVRGSDVLDVRNWIFCFIWLGAVLLLFSKPLFTLASVSLSDENVSHTLLIPLLAAGLLYVDRTRIFGATVSDPVMGVCFALATIGATAWAYYSQRYLRSPDALTYYILAFVMACLAGFTLIFGRQALRRGAFPLAFLFLMVPWPSFILDPAISYLQRGSAEIASAVFDISGVPVLREGMVFHLASATIEVAPECSGIRSSIALLILALLVSHFEFRPFWKKALFIAAGLLMMIIKNGIRIATLTLLASYVNPGFLYGRLHRQGGVVFFLMGLGLLLPVYRLLKRGERQPGAGQPISDAD
jgi:exosortase